MTSVIPHSKPCYSVEDYNAVAQCLDSYYTASGGPASKFLIMKLEKYYNSDLVMLTSSGTTALILALIAIGIKPGESVILPNYICREVYDAVKFLGITPVLADVESNTYTLNNLTVEEKINSKVKGIIFPHMFGFPGMIKGLNKFNLPIIEDLSQGLGVKIGNKNAGEFGDVSLLSFKSIKMLGGGEGGALILNTPKSKENIKNFLSGADKFYPPLLFSMSDLTASLVLSQWDKMDVFVCKRKSIAINYLNSFKNLNFDLPLFLEENSWHRFPIKLVGDVSFENIQKKYYENGVVIRKPVDNLLNELLSIEGEFPTSREIFEKTISIPLYPALKEDEIDKIIKVTNKIFG
ncbi:DegT/DnrJ/EryC1/StrS family aminotransferase [Bacillus tianshenii]|nr:DegT/DnrJ/EryC1/StrS family aminotransferase [Bacillus tianshenii]